MKRVGRLWPRVIAFDTLLRAARRASLGKRASRSVAAFLERAEPECLALARDLEAGTWRPGRPSRFQILDPKPRTITAAPFQDQVVHHALIDVLEPIFERRMIADSYACRRGKGTHAAVHRVRAHVGRFPWFLKLDVASFFASAPHAAVRDAIGRIVKDPRVLSLCATILAGWPGDPPVDRGLPIGSLTSQWFANVLLDRVDHLVVDSLGIPGYARYMDDMVLFDLEKDRLKRAHTAITAFLDDPLGLQLKDRATILAPVDEGVPFLGRLVFRGTVRIRPENLRRYRLRLRERRREFRTGRRTEASYVRSVAALFELLRSAHTRALRLAWLDREALAADEDPVAQSSGGRHTAPATA